MALKVIKKNRFLSPDFRRMFCNALIQPHLITPVLPGTLILLKNEKENKNYAE